MFSEFNLKTYILFYRRNLQYEFADYSTASDLLVNSKISFMKNLKMSMLFFLFLLLFSCKPDTTPGSGPITGVLSDAEENAMLWADVAAGFASAGMGPASFLIAGAASTAYYYDHIPTSQRLYHYQPATFNYSSDEDIIGVDHNTLCQKYIESNDPVFGFKNLKEIAKEVRPDLIEDIDVIQSEYFENIYSEIQNFDFKDENSIIAYFRNFITINDDDANKLKAYFHELQACVNASQMTELVNSAIQDVENFSLPTTDKQRLKNSFVIFKYSSLLWKRF